jgi:hypothetical protein
MVRRTARERMDIEAKRVRLPGPTGRAKRRRTRGGSSQRSNASRRSVDTAGCRSSTGTT